MPKSLRVLVIEDCESDVDLIVAHLSRGGFELTYEQVQNAPELQSALTRRTWDIVLSDYLLPHFDAQAALKILRARQPDLPVIIISGTIGEETAVAAMRAGASDYLVRDNLSRLIPAIDRELRDSEGRRRRRETERTLRQKEAELAAIFDHAPIAMILVDETMQIRSINRTGCAISGQASADLVGQPIEAALHCMHADESAQGCRFSPACRNCNLHDAIERTLTEGTAQHDVELAIPIECTPSRVTLHFTLSANPLLLDGCRMAVVCLEDYTERKAASEARDRHAAALRLSNRELSASRRELAQFIHSSTHDLRAPIVSIHGFASRLKNHLADHLDEKAAHYLDRVLGNALHVEVLLADLVHVARIMPEHVVFHPLRTQTLVADVMDDLGPRAREAGVKLLCPNSLPSIIGHADSLREMLQQLIGNAILYGGTDVTIGFDAEMPGPERSVGAFFVQDQGPGLPTLYHKRVFQLFRRGPEGLPRSPGTGIGLPIARRIVTAHGGVIWIASEPDEGCTIYFTLPIAFDSERDVQPTYSASGGITR